MERLDPATAAYVNASGLAKASPMGMGLYRIEPVGTVGSVRTPTVQLEVRPEGPARAEPAPVPAQLRGGPGFRDDSVAAVEHTDLWSALAESLAQLADRALSRGVLQGYLMVEESLRTVKGRIRISDQISRRPGMLVPLEVSYDEFTEDIAENRILRAALERMAQVPRVRPEVLSRLRQLKGKLDAVTRLQSGAPLPQWRPSRMNARYHVRSPARRTDPAERLGGGRRRQAAVGVVRGGHGEGVRGLRRDGTARSHGRLPRGDAAALQRPAQRGRPRLGPDRGPARCRPFPRRPARDGVRRQVQGRGRRRRVTFGRPLPDAGLLHILAGADGVDHLPGRRGNQAAPDPQYRHRHCRVPAGSVASRRRKSWPPWQISPSSPGAKCSGRPVSTGPAG